MSVQKFLVILISAVFFLVLLYLLFKFNFDSNFLNVYIFFLTLIIALFFLPMCFPIGLVFLLKMLINLH